jgi:hypothetical protein
MVSRIGFLVVKAPSRDALFSVIYDVKYINLIDFERLTSTSYILKELSQLTRKLLPG